MSKKNRRLLYAFMRVLFELLTALLRNLQPLQAINPRSEYPEMFNFLKKKQDHTDNLLGFSDDEYCNVVKGVFDNMDEPTRAHILVAFQHVFVLVQVMKVETKKRGMEWTTKDLIRDFANAQKLAKDEVNIRRQAWLMWATMLHRMGEISKGSAQKMEVLGEVWCNIARASPLLKSLLPDNIVWDRDEKSYFDLVINEDDEELVIWAINSGNSGVSKTAAVRKLADEYSSIIYSDWGLQRLPERLRP